MTTTVVNQDKITYQKPETYSENCLACHGICPSCLRPVSGIECRRMNTRYVDEDRNWLVSCLQCFLDMEEYWKENWEEYYSGCL